MRDGLYMRIGPPAILVEPDPVDSDIVAHTQRLVLEHRSDAAQGDTDIGETIGQLLGPHTDIAREAGLWGDQLRRRGNRKVVPVLDDAGPSPLIQLAHLKPDNVAADPGRRTHRPLIAIADAAGLGMDPETGPSLIGAQHRIADVDIVPRVLALGNRGGHGDIDRRPDQPLCLEWILGDRQCAGPRNVASAPDLREKAAFLAAADIDFTGGEFDGELLALVEQCIDRRVLRAAPAFIIDLD